jgi:hypothetical protein
VCATAIRSPRSASAELICSEQPGFADTSTTAPVARTLDAFRSPSSRAASG